MFVCLYQRTTKIESHEKALHCRRNTIQYHERCFELCRIYGQINQISQNTPACRVAHIRFSSNLVTLKNQYMKAQVHVDGKKIWESNRISAENLEKKVDQLKREHKCQKMAEIVRRGFKVFTA